LFLNDKDKTNLHMQARIGAASYREKLGGPIQIRSYRLKISCFQL